MLGALAGVVAGAIGGVPIWLVLSLFMSVNLDEAKALYDGHALLPFWPFWGLGAGVLFLLSIGCAMVGLSSPAVSDRSDDQEERS